MKNEILEFMPRDCPSVLDLTFGLGGHTGFLLTHNKDTKAVGVDRDLNLLKRGFESLSIPIRNRVRILHNNFNQAVTVLAEEGFKAGYVLLDLGLNSAQLDDPSRGYSFLKEGPLDMRMNSSDTLTAADIVNEYPKAELARIFFCYGEERYGKRVAEKIVRRRQKKTFKTTSELREVIESVIPFRPDKSKIHRATRIFQALRIAVNDEINSLESVLRGLPSLCIFGSRIVVLSFHSLEDRLVKQYFSLWAKDCVCDPDLPVCRCEHKKTVKILTKKPLIPGQQEIRSNPRSRSAKLRAVEFITA